MPSPTVLGHPSNPPRLRTIDLGGMPIEINGVQIPVQQWDISYANYAGSPVEVRLTLLADFVPAEPEPETATTADCCEPPPQGCRYIAEIHPASGPYDHVDCDTATVDKRGYLRLDLADIKDVAVYAPGTWLNYRLIAPPKDEPGMDSCCAVADPEPEPDAPAPINVTINVSGSVPNERDLRDMIQKQLQLISQMNPKHFRR